MRYSCIQPDACSRDSPGSASFTGNHRYPSPPSGNNHAAVSSNLSFDEVLCHDPPQHREAGAETQGPDRKENMSRTQAYLNKKAPPDIEKVARFVDDVSTIPTVAT